MPVKMHNIRKTEKGERNPPTVIFNGVEIQVSDTVKYLGETLDKYHLENTYLSSRAKHTALLG